MKYEAYKMTATADDGTNVPITVVHKEGLKLNKNNPCVMMAYGAYVRWPFPTRRLRVTRPVDVRCRYGIDMDTTFDVPLITLIRRGWVIAYAHPRCVASAGDAGLRAPR